MWYHDLFCGTNSAPERFAQPGSDRRPEPQRCCPGRADFCGCVLRHPFQLQPEDSGFQHLRILRSIADHDPEHARGATRRGLWLRRRFAALDQLSIREGRWCSKGLERPFVEHLHHAQRQLHHCSESAVDGAHRGGQHEQRHVRAESAGRIPRERQSGRIGGPGVCAEFELRLLRAQADCQRDAFLLRRFKHLAEGCHGLRAAECSGLVPVPDAEP